MNKNLNSRTFRQKLNRKKRKKAATQQNIQIRYIDIAVWHSTFGRFMTVVAVSSQAVRVVASDCFRLCDFRIRHRRSCFSWSIYMLISG